MFRILVNAYAVSPNRGSEPGMGWNWCIRLAEKNELFIITEGEFKSEIDHALQDLPQAGNMHFYFLPVSPRVRRMCWNQGDWRFYLHYAVWQRRALALARELSRIYQFDIIHQLNMVGFRESGLLWEIQGPRFIWGPVCGMALTPVQYFRDAPWQERIRIRFKNAITTIQSRYSSRVVQAIRRASVVLCVTKEDYDIVSRTHHGHAMLLNETGTSGNLIPVSRNHDPIRLIWVGRFIHSKQLGLALRTLSLLKDCPVLLDVVGTGTPSQQQYYHDLADRLGIGGQLVWHGQVPHDQVGNLMDQADVFFFTSVSEATSTVTMEAISHGLPVVCFDICGFGPVVGDDMGVKIPLTTPEDSVFRFADALRNLVEHPAMREGMSQACYRKAPTLSWDVKIGEVCRVYSEVLSTKR